MAKILAGALLFAGVCWSFIAFGDLAPEAPAWSAWLGPAGIVVGLPLLFLFGAHHGEEKWDAGEWVEVEGTVDRVVTHGEFAVFYMRVRFSSPVQGAFKYDAQISNDRQREFVNQAKGATVLADVRSNDRRVVNVKTVDGRSWTVLSSERARTASRNTRGTRPTV
ncbi:MAG: hypothetical protein M3550_00295 [Actinomycetota bacterium]|nr:hypothetical protein [Actinomycetota bacterium]